MQETDKEMDSIQKVVKSVNNIIDGKFTLPLMVAYSGLVNDDVRKNAKEAGFKVVLESPLTVDMIKHNILPYLESRSENISYVKKQFTQSLNRQSKFEKKFLPIQEKSEKSEEIDFSKSHAFSVPSISDQSCRGLVERMAELNNYAYK